MSFDTRTVFCSNGYGARSALGLCRGRSRVCARQRVLLWQTVTRPKKKGEPQVSLTGIWPCQFSVVHQQVRTPEFKRRRRSSQYQLGQALVCLLGHLSSRIDFIRITEGDSVLQAGGRTEARGKFVLYFNEMS